MRDEPAILPRHLEIEVIHEIAPKGSATVGRRREGSAFVRSASAGLAAYQGAIEAASYGSVPGCSSRAGPAGSRRTLVEVHFYFSRPARSRYEHPVRLDIDKCARAVLDVLTNVGVIEDDRHVISLVASKDYIEPRDDMEDLYGRPWGSIDQTFVGVYPWRKRRAPRWERSRGTRRRRRWSAPAFMGSRLIPASVRLVHVHGVRRAAGGLESVAGSGVGSVSAVSRGGSGCAVSPHVRAEGRRSGSAPAADRRGEGARSGRYAAG